MYKFGLSIILTTTFFFAACGSVETTTGEDYGDITASPSGLTLTEGEHAEGWARSDCTICHNLYNIHLRDDVPGVDMAAVRQLVEDDGLSACPRCHGANGVE